MKYIKGKGYYVGTFTESDLVLKNDKRAVAQAMEATNLRYVNTDIVYQNGAAIGIKLYVCSKEEMKI